MYYRSAGNAFTPYLIYPHTEYDTTLLRCLLHDVPEPEVESHLRELIAFAVAHEFDEQRLISAEAVAGGRV
ncbi:hypothetical protein B5M42_021720 [Paenibacillus athensensis]|uniref:hypothetical protein n=1 Tax=Paenibacillus athensensis TaxID=1967502 RepID=UPI00106F46E7|nr:hypothetical protein [Paenibacillus athensensis]MCD1261424.1 hypothetical protein [Paenibacillus athensensis]